MRRSRAARADPRSRALDGREAVAAEHGGGQVVGPDRQEVGVARRSRSAAATAAGVSIIAPTRRAVGDARARAPRRPPRPTRPSASGCAGRSSRPAARIARDLRLAARRADASSSRSPRRGVPAQEGRRLVGAEVEHAHRRQAAGEAVPAPARARARGRSCDGQAGASRKASSVRTSPAPSAPGGERRRAPRRRDGGVGQHRHAAAVAGDRGQVALGERPLVRPRARVHRRRAARELARRDGSRTALRPRRRRRRRRPRRDLEQRRTRLHDHRDPARPRDDRGVPGDGAAGESERDGVIGELGHVGGPDVGRRSPPPRRPTRRRRRAAIRAALRPTLRTSSARAASIGSSIEASSAACASAAATSAAGAGSPSSSTHLGRRRQQTGSRAIIAPASTISASSAASRRAGATSRSAAVARAALARSDSASRRPSGRRDCRIGRITIEHHDGARREPRRGARGREHPSHASACLQRPPVRARA